MSRVVRDELVEEIRRRADIVEICGEHMSLKRVGKSFRGPCPLHGGEGPNFSIDRDRGLFKCFVCGEGGDVFSFVMKHLGHDFPSAVRHVAGKVGIEVPDREDRREDPHAGLRGALAFALEWFRERLAGEEGREARRYLEERGLKREEADRFGLGFAPDSWQALRESAHRHGIDDEMLLEAGLLATSERAERPYDRFRHRLVFPIFDLQDRPLGFGGRDLSGEEAVPKYINSPDSPVFHKREILYGLNWARHAMRRTDRALVVEGYTDVLALHARQVETAVAPLGTSLSEDQAETLTRYADRVYLLYDSDEGGLRATFRSADILLAAGAHPMVVTLPEGEDPDSLVRREGVDRLKELLEDAVGPLERKLQILERKGYLETVEGRRRAVDGLLSTLRAVRDPALRDLYLGRAAERLGVRRETLAREVAREPRRPRARRRRREGPGYGRGREGGRSPETAPGGGGAGAAERTLLLLLLRDPSLVERADEKGLEEGHFRGERFAAIFRGLRRAVEEDRHGDWSAVFDEDLMETVGELLADATELTHPAEIFDNVLGRLILRPKLERLRAIDRELELVEEDRARELLDEKQRLARELRQGGVPVSFLHRLSGEG